jgi:hypothetical protein
VLVYGYKERQDKLESSQNSSAWAEILDEVNLAGSTKTKENCKRRFKYLKSKFQNAKKHNKISGNDPQFTAFYDIFDEMFGSRPIQVLQHLKETGIVMQPESDDSSSTVNKPPNYCHDESVTIPKLIVKNKRQRPIDDQETSSTKMVKVILNAQVSLSFKKYTKAFFNKKNNCFSQKLSKKFLLLRKKPVKRTELLFVKLLWLRMQLKRVTEVFFWKCLSY